MQCRAHQGETRLALTSEVAMARFTPHQVELTPQLLPPNMLKLTWSLHMLSHRDHALWRVEAHVGSTEDLVGLGVYPCPPVKDLALLTSYARSAMTIDIAAAHGYMYPKRESFPGPPRGGAPAA